nr:polysaccharide pyruvyl transferase family protein [uncultured Marinifilum sp.]
MKIYFDALSLKPTTSIGTQAFIIAGMELIQKKYPKAEFILLAADPIVEEHYLKNTNINYRLIKRDPSYLGTWKQVRKILKEVNAVVASWGDGYITFPPHYLLRKTIMLRKRNVPLILFTSSIGPFTGRLKKLMAVLGLKLFDVLTVRDSITFEYLKSLKFKNVKLVHDSAFVLQPSSAKKVEVLLANAGLQSGDYIGLNISVLMYNLFKGKGLDYSKLMAEYATWLVQTFKLPVILVPHQIYPQCHTYTREQYESRGGDDRYAIDKVLENIQNTNMIIPLKEEYSPMELKGIIRGSEIFIGGRMHTIIGAISTATPALIMQYSHKAGGMMKFLNMQENLWDINENLECLKNRTQLLWENKSKIRERLLKELPAMKKEIYDLADYLPEENLK